MFARQATSLLELACRVCKADDSGKTLQNFSAALAKRDRRYFTELPGPCWSPSKRTEKAFKLPSLGAYPNNELIAALFNLVRNGLSHQYQQMRAVLSDDKEFGVSLTGAECGYTLARTFAEGRPPRHLSADRDDNGNLWITVMPNVLFLDLRDAIREIGLDISSTGFKHMAEEGHKTFDFSTTDAENALRNNGHM